MPAMARMLFNLRHVEADEFDEVTQALDAAGVAWYQTAPGLFGISAPGLWLHDPAQLEQARAAIAASQQARALRLRAQADADGGPAGLAGHLRAAPLQVLGGLLLIVAIIALVVAAPWLLWR